MQITDPPNFPGITHTYRRHRARPASGLLSIVVSLGLFTSGYFAGREHLKYELRSVMQQAGEVMKEFGNPFLPNSWGSKAKQVSPVKPTVSSQ